MNKHEELRNILIESGSPEFGDAVIDQICTLFGYPTTTGKTTQFLAIVPTYYEIYAVGSTEEEAKSKALTVAMEWLALRAVEYENDIRYTTTAEVEEQLGCNVFPIIDGVAQEG